MDRFLDSGLVTEHVTCVVCLSESIPAGALSGLTARVVGLTLFIRKPYRFGREVRPPIK